MRALALAILGAFTFGCAVPTRAVTVLAPSEPCPALLHPCHEEARRPNSCAPSPLVGRVLWESPEGDLRVYEKCTWAPRSGGEPAAHDTEVIVEHPGREPVTQDSLRELWSTLPATHTSIPEAASFGPGICRPEFAPEPKVPCLSLRLVTKRAHVEDLARQAQKILAPLTDETCVLLDIELNAGRPELLRARE